MKLLAYKKYCEDVSRIFDLAMNSIIQVLPFARVEHIGASSIPGSLSKGDLDIFVGVPLSEHGKSIVKLREIGFFEKKDTFRSNELCMMVSDHFNYDVAIQLVSNGSRFENFITFRDILREDSFLLEEYNNIKKRFITSPVNIYREEKSNFINDVLRKYDR